MDWDPIRPNSVADPALVEHLDGDAGSAAVFVEELAASYRNEPMRIDASLAAFLGSPSPSPVRDRKRSLRRRVAGIAVPIAAVLSLGVANMLPAAAQSALADVARAVGVSIPEPGAAHDGAHDGAHNDKSPSGPSGAPSPKPKDREPRNLVSTPGSPSSEGGAAEGSTTVPSGNGPPESPGNSAGHSEGNGPPESPGNSAGHSEGNGPPESPGNSAGHSEGNGPPESPGNSAGHSEGNGPPESPGRP